MIRDEHIETAIARGILTPDQAEGLRAIARDGRGAAFAGDGAADPDDERFRLIGGFNDVFVTIGVGLLIAALVGLANAFKMGPWFGVLALVAAWILSEIFAVRLRLALPSIALAAMFAGAGAYLFGIFSEVLTGALGITGEPVHGFERLLVGLGVVIAAGAHDLRFRVPVDTAILVGGFVCVLSGALGTLAPIWTRDNTSLLMGLFGLGVFVAALRVDSTDPLRTTRRADVAFWLHLMAAPMIVHPVMSLVYGQASVMNGWQALTVLAVFLLLGIVALVIDRRALLVSGLTYAGIALAYLLQQGVDAGTGVALTLLGLSLLVLGLSLGWRAIRAAIVPRLPLGPLSHVLPPV